eukprot:8822140-Lingulodinium_polyedra.AAC.1
MQLVREARAGGDVGPRERRLAVLPRWRGHQGLHRGGLEELRGAGQQPVGPEVPRVVQELQEDTGAPKAGARAHRRVQHDRRRRGEDR